MSLTKNLPINLGITINMSSITGGLALCMVK